MIYIWRKTNSLHIKVSLKVFVFAGIFLFSAWQLLLRKFLSIYNLENLWIHFVGHQNCMAAWSEEVFVMKPTTPECVVENDFFLCLSSKLKFIKRLMILTTRCVTEKRLHLFNIILAFFYHVKITKFLSVQKILLCLQMKTYRRLTLIAVKRKLSKYSITLL